MFKFKLHRLHILIRKNDRNVTIEPKKFRFLVEMLPIVHFVSALGSLFRRFSTFIFFHIGVILRRKGIFETFGASNWCFSMAFS